MIRKRMTMLFTVLFLLAQSAPVLPAGLNGLDGSLQNNAIQNSANPPTIAPGGMTGTDGRTPTTVTSGTSTPVPPTISNEEYPDEIADQPFVVLRSSQTLDSASVAVLPFDTRMKVLEQGNGWCRVKTKLGEGYIRTRYIKRFAASSNSGQSASSPSMATPLRDAPAAGTGTPNQHNGPVHLRADMKVDSADLGQIPPGANVHFISQEGGWCKVEWNGKTGYMRGMYLGIKPKAPTRPVAVKPVAAKPVVSKPVAVKPVDKPKRIGSEDNAASPKGGKLAGRPVKGGRVTSEFGPRKLFGNSYHYGIDIGVPTGTPALALGNGSVSKVGYDKGGGNYIDIKYDNGYSTRYYHMKNATLKQGARVTAGATIGHTNNTGSYTTGAHLHFEVKNSAGKRVNPRTVPGLTF